MVLVWFDSRVVSLRFSVPSRKPCRKCGLVKMGAIIMIVSLLRVNSSQTRRQTELVSLLLLVSVNVSSLPIFIFHLTTKTGIE